MRIPRQPSRKERDNPEGMEAWHTRTREKLDRAIEKAERVRYPDPDSPVDVKTKREKVLAALFKAPIVDSPRHRIDEEKVEGFVERAITEHRKLHKVVSELGSDGCDILRYPQVDLAAWWDRCNINDGAVRAHGRYCIAIGQALLWPGFALWRSNPKTPIEFHHHEEHYSYAEAIAYLKRIGMKEDEIGLLVAVQSAGGKVPYDMTPVETMRSRISSRMNERKESLEKKRQAKERKRERRLLKKQKLDEDRVKKSG